MDTSNILFVASGAFVHLERIVGRRLENKALGFGATENSISEGLKDGDEARAMRCRDSLVAKAESVDLIAYAAAMVHTGATRHFRFGMLPELVGRFPVIVPFHSLDEDMLLRVMCEPQNSMIAQARKQFHLDGIQLTFTDDALRAIANEAYRKKTGVRALRFVDNCIAKFPLQPATAFRSIVERVLLDAKFESPDSDILEVVVDENAVRDNTKFISKRSAEDKPKAA